MILSNEQKKALDSGQVVPLVVDGTECVVLRRDVFELGQREVPFDDGAWTAAEKESLLKAVGKKAGWDDPELDVYEQYRKQP
jgi:hypothetical protein